jgi:hypothetical protein
MGHHAHQHSHLLTASSSAAAAAMEPRYAYETKDEFNYF